MFEIHASRARYNHVPLELVQQLVEQILVEVVLVEMLVPTRLQASRWSVSLSVSLSVLLRFSLSVSIWEYIVHQSTPQPTLYIILAMCAHSML